MDPEDIAIKLGRPYRIVVDVLVAEQVIRPGRPKVREKTMQAMATMYNDGRSIRAVAEEFGRSYGGTHRVLEYMQVKFRSPGGNQQRRSRS